MATSIKRDNTARNTYIKARKDNKMQKKLLELQKHYPNNEYEIQEVETDPKKNKKTYIVDVIVRVKGRVPHKTKKIKPGATNIK